MNLGLENKVAMVAAASKGLGYGVAEALDQEGSRVSICRRTQADIDAAAKKLADETDAETMGVVCDATSADDINNWVKATVDKWGQVDVLLVNAGGPPSGFFKTLSEEQWQAAFELTLLSSIRMIKTAIPHMPPGSAILTVTSSSIIVPIEGLALSTVMRAGVNGLVKTLAEELAPDGIRVNNLMPGRIDTDRVAHLNQISAERQGISVEEVRIRSEKGIPLKRAGTIQEFGRAGAFLLSPAASYITGASLRVDGGNIRAISS
jgi:3-oxoacyl-[acyl-carrier protein] reductase